MILKDLEQNVSKIVDNLASGIWHDFGSCRVTHLRDCNGGKYAIQIGTTYRSNLEQDVAVAIAIGHILLHGD